MFGNQRVRLMREEPWTADALAQELYAMFDDAIDLQHTGIITMTASSPAFIFLGYSDGDTIMQVGPREGEKTDIIYSGGTFVADGQADAAVQYPIIVLNGGTGLSEVPVGDVLIGNGSEAMSSAALVAGAGISITPAPGVIVISAPAAGNVATESTGTTGDAYDNIFTLTNANGLHGSISIKNSGTPNSMDIKLTATDLFGNSGSVENAGQVPGSYNSYDLDNTVIGTGVKAPYKILTLALKSTTPGAATTYGVWRSIIG